MALLAYLEDHFGSLSATTVRRLKETPFDRLQPFITAAWSAKWLAELGLEG